MERCRKVGQTALVKHDWPQKKEKKGFLPLPSERTVPMAGRQNASDQF